MKKVVAAVFLVILTGWFHNNIDAQSINGIVMDNEKNLIGYVNIWINDYSVSTYSDENGKFILNISNSNIANDSLVFGVLGFQTLKLALKDIDIKELLMVELKQKELSIDEIIIKTKRPIAEEFSAQQLNQLDILMNPVAAADPLKAILLLPASTNTDESANPSLRGSSPNRSRVVLNGVPVYNPVKTASDLDSKGSFSLFNTAIISNEQVYASNPPIAYSNVTAGIVEIETVEELKSHTLDFTTGLSGFSLLLSQPIKNEKNFCILYSNYQVPQAFISLNNDAFHGRLKDFSDKDAGMLLHFNTGEQSSINLYSYITQESGQYRLNLFA
ncbi:MAG: TonB-dependent receptor, partial [Chloroflexia bacterium]|nr:TonB-dependent receptor [Chloroflexia bacterium]